MPMNRTQPGSRRYGGGERGLSLVELMVGIAVGMFVVAAASMVASTQLSGNRRLIVETQLQQDLRAVADIITRDVRRAGATGTNANVSRTTIWTPNHAAAVNTLTPVTVASDRVEFFAQRTSGAAGPYGYKVEDGIIKTQLVGPGWQPLTDNTIMTVTGFAVTAVDEPAVVVPCPTLCPGGTQDCWPTVTVRAISVTITAKAVADPAIVRTVTTLSRLKNDMITYRATPATQAGPS